MSASKKEINIVGAGAFGVFLSYLIAKGINKKSYNYKVSLHEIGADILPGWKSVSMEGVRINNGFHGLEMPRAKEAMTFCKKW